MRARGWGCTPRRTCSQHANARAHMHARLCPCPLLRSAQGLANMVWGLGSLGQKPPQQWLRAMYAATRRRLADWRPQGVSAWAQGAAKLQLHVPDPLLEGLME